MIIYIYISRKGEETGLVSIEDCVELAIRGLEVYMFMKVRKDRHRLLEETR